MISSYMLKNPTHLHDIRTGAVSRARVLTHLEGAYANFIIRGRHDGGTATPTTRECQTSRRVCDVLVVLVVVIIVIASSVPRRPSTIGCFDP